MTNASIAEALLLPGPQRKLDVSEQPTEPVAREREDTDERLAGEPTLDGDPLFDSAPPEASFEHRRIVSLVRQQLFGEERKLRIGRYALLRHLGSGGMGDVYLARDEALDRSIAVKRVRVSSANERDQERLRREARALARLSHPNVVQIYEVDEHEGRTFLAMEYVDGQNLGEWLAEQPRAWRAILDRFLAAGRGLAAAHEAGLVHRDFKPENVLLGRDDSVRVADFGLALTGEDHRTTAHASSGLPPPDTRLSVVGAVIGTIRYMSLEQLCGGEVDARSDQFSFCVALYEALWGEPPFSLSSSLARVTELQTAEPTPPRARPDSRPPAALWRVIRRGLQRDPSSRWPDMRTLLVALHGVTRRRRRLTMLGSAVAAVGMLLGVATAHEASPPDPCTGVQRELEGTWDDERRAALDATAVSLAASHVADSHARVLAGLDRWGTGWTDVRMATCRAVDEQRVEPELARQQNACLTHQRQRVGDLVELLLRPGTDGDVLAGAVDAVAELPSPASCTDASVLLGMDPPAPALADRVDTLRRDVDRAHELRLLGHVDEGLTLAEATEQAARALGYGPLHAEALAELAKAELVGGSLPSAMARLQDAIDEAELVRHDVLVAELWAEAAARTLTDLSDARAGSWELRRAEVANGRIEPSARSRARLLFARGQLAELHQDLGEAERNYRAAIVNAEPDDAAALDIPSYWSNLARLAELRDPSGREALPLHKAALDGAEQHYGPRHPQTARRLYLLASALQARDPERAAALLRRAAEIWTASPSAPPRDLASAHIVLARLALNAGELSEATSRAHVAATIRAQVLPPGHIELGDPAQLLATIYAVRGEHELALEQAKTALALWEPEYGSGTLAIQRLRSDIVAMLLALGRVDEATEELDALLPHVLGGPEEVSVRLHRCEAALRQGRLDAADAELRSIEHDTDLGPHELSFAVLRGLIDLRRGDPRPPALGRIRSARARTPFTTDQIVEWRTQLEMSPAEQLALPLD